MLKSNIHKIFIGCCSSLLIAVICFAVFLKLNKVEAAVNCGDVVAPGLPVPVACSCGDTVMSDYTFPADLNCTSAGLTIGAIGITIDGNNHNFNFTGGLNATRSKTAISGIGFNNIIIQNLKINGYWSSGIHLWGINFATPINNLQILNNIIDDSRSPLDLLYTNNVVITGNTINKGDNDTLAIFSSNLTFNNNIILYNGRTSITSGAGSTISNNKFYRGRNTIQTLSAATISNNQIIDAAKSEMINWLSSQSGPWNAGDTVPIDFYLQTIRAVACPTCTYTLTTSPAEVVTQGKSGNHVTGSFIPSRTGTYTLKVTITEPAPASNYYEKQFIYLIGTTTPRTVRYYFSPDLPIHGQGAGTDARSLKLTAPISNDEWACDVWIGNSIEQIPDYPLGILNNIDYQAWYRNIPRPIPASNGVGTNNTIGFTQYAGYDLSFTNGIIDIPFLLYIKPYVYTQPGTKITRSFSGLNIPMNYPWTWYDLEFKLLSQTYNDGPDIQTFVADPSYADFHYATAYPAVKSNSSLNDLDITNDIDVLSATQINLTQPNNIELVVAGTGSTDIVIGEFTSPFAAHESIIYPDQTTKIELSGLAGTSAYQTINMNATPDSGNIKINITTWDTGGLHYKKWTEDGNLAGIVTTHNIGDLAPWTKYTIKVDTVNYDIIVSNAQGVATFVYNGGYSLKTFEFVEGAFIGPPASSSGLIFNGSAEVVINVDEPKTTSENVTLTLTSTQATQMLISNDPSFDTATWEPFSSSRTWALLPGLGEKTVYVKFRNFMGANSPLITDSINLVTEEILVETPMPAPILCSEQLPEGLSIGNLLKIENSKTVYFIGMDNCRHPFPNESTYFTWFANFTEVKTIPIETISEISMGKNITVRPGTALVKIQSQAQVYLVEPGAKLRSLGSESLAAQLFGIDWSRLVIDIPDTFFTDYQMGEPASAFTNGTLIQYLNDPNVYYLENSKKRMINFQLFNELFQAKYLIRNVSSISDYADGLIFPTTTKADIMTWQ
ncbi:MAG: right-handed parallel beta-helix repeat-containing protein [Candidatus Parcubacteria bacterium]|nr:right-handed parallel beta-helix repeat-containing protein [Candidatus Parcubacteria bacterium]